MIDRLFVYGTLEIPEVLRAVTGRAFPARFALLEGYERTLLRGEVYPAIIPARGHRTAGTLYSGIDAGTLDLLDRFEGPPYRRIQAPVGIPRDPAQGQLEPGKGRESSPDTVLLETAFLYALPASLRHLLSDEPWDRGRFEREHLRNFLGTVGGRLARDAEGAP